MSVLKDDMLREGTVRTDVTQEAEYNDRAVYWALGAVAALTPVLLIVVLLVTPGTGLMLDLWLAFGGANLLVWPVVLVAGLVDSARRAMRTARVARRAVERRLELARETRGVEAAAA